MRNPRKREVEPSDPWLRLDHVVSRDENARPMADQRRRVTRIIASYRCASGYEWRKAFESYGEPHVPEAGFNRALTAQQNQF